MNSSTVSVTVRTTVFLMCQALAAVLLELREHTCAICENDRVHTEGAIIPQTAYDVQAFRPAGFDSRPFPDASIMANDSSEKLYEVCASIR